MGLEDARANRLTRSTAEGAALMRAAGTLVSDPAVRGPDHMAADLIGPGLNAAALIKLPLARRLVPAVIDRMLPGAVWFEVARTCAMDEMLLARFGLELVEDVGSEEGARRYLTDSHGRRPDRVWEFGGVVRACVPLR